MIHHFRSQSQKRYRVELSFWGKTNHDRFDGPFYVVQHLFSSCPTIKGRRVHELTEKTIPDRLRGLIICWCLVSSSRGVPSNWESLEHEASGVEDVWYQTYYWLPFKMTIHGLKSDLKRTRYCKTDEKVQNILSF